MSESDVPRKVAASLPGPCPICAKPRVEAYRPFCSKHCADVDLGRWLNGAYAIPVADDDADEDGVDSAEMSAAQVRSAH